MMELSVFFLLYYFALMATVCFVEYAQVFLIFLVIGSHFVFSVSCLQCVCACVANNNYLSHVYS